MRGGGFLRFFLFFMLFSAAIVGMGFLFAATSNSSGVVRTLPLVAVFALLIAGTAALLRKALK